MILLISTCAEKFHEPEFVKPIKKILQKNKIKCFIKHLSEIKQKDLEKADKIIICGTSLKDDYFLNSKLEFSKPTLGICAGMHLIGLNFNGKLRQNQEIGQKEIKFKENFLGINEKQKVYLLHNRYIDFSKISKFKVFSNLEKISYAVKHKTKPIYGVLFHPEVLNKKLITNFCKT